MAVPKWKREEGKIPILDKASALMKHTYIKTANENYFPKRRRWQYAYAINGASQDVYTLIRAANSVMVKSKADYEIRRGRMLEVRGALEKLVGLLTIAYELHPIPDKEIDYWVGLVIDVETDLNKWLESEYQTAKRKGYV